MILRRKGLGVMEEEEEEEVLGGAVLPTEVGLVKVIFGILIAI